MQTISRFLSRGHEHLLAPGAEGWAIHSAVDHGGRCHTVDAQRGHERQCLPLAVRNLSDQPLAERSAAVEPCHLRRHCRLVDEDEARGLERGLLSSQLLTGSGDIRLILLGSVQNFFLNVISWRS
jgi:hypothetical protein